MRSGLRDGKGLPVEQRVGWRLYLFMASTACLLWFHLIPSCACVKEWGGWKFPICRPLSIMISLMCFLRGKHFKSFKSLITWKFSHVIVSFIWFLGSLNAAVSLLRQSDLTWCPDGWFITDFLNSTIPLHRLLCTWTPHADDWTLNKGCLCGCPIVPDVVGGVCAQSEVCVCVFWIWQSN